MTCSPPSSAAPPLSPGDDVRTPSGAKARIIAVDEAAGEALVYWPERSTKANCEQARFRLRLLSRWAG